jgi:hypothetical protein
MYRIGATDSTGSPAVDSLPMPADVPGRIGAYAVVGQDASVAGLTSAAIEETHSVSNRWDVACD